MKTNFNDLDGFIEDSKHFYTLKVFYEDTDAGEIVYHANYLKYFERARTSLLNLLKINQLNLKNEHGIFFVVRKADIKWHKPSKLNDTLLIETCLKYAKNSSMIINQKAYRYIDNEKQELLVSGIIQIVATNSQSKVIRIKKVLNNEFFQNKFYK